MTSTGKTKGQRAGSILLTLIRNTMKQHAYHRKELKMIEAEAVKLIKELEELKKNV